MPLEQRATPEEVVEVVELPEEEVEVLEEEVVVEQIKEISGLQVKEMPLLLQHSMG